MRTNSRGWVLGLTLSWAGAALSVETPPARGQLLYETHCIECHTTQLHWRANRRVTDWASLLSFVDQWQGRAHLNWTRADVEAVARHLDRTVYRLSDAPTRAE